MFFITSGCYTVTIDPIEKWEGHFFSENEALKALDNFKLKKGQSVWILSNSTLSRVLKNNRKK